MNGITKTIYPAISLRRAVLFPSERAPLILEGKEAISTVKNAIKDDKLIVLKVKNGKESKIGVLGTIVQYWFFKPEVMGIVIEGLKRVEIKTSFTDGNVNKVETADLTPPAQMSEHESTDLTALSHRVFERLKEFIQMHGIVPVTVAHQLQREHLDPDQISDIIAAALNIKFEEKLLLLEKINPYRRLEILNNKLTRELNVTKTEQKIEHEVEKEIGRVQREYILREHLKVIEKELGIFEENKEYTDLENKLKQAKLPKAIEEKAIKELNRLKKMTANSAEAPYIRTYLDWISDLPWSRESKSKVDLIKAQKILDEDHYGLEKVKERIIEYLAVQKLTKGKGRTNILCFAGPPGTGKTSVAQSIARALGRKFVKISLGGIHDEAEIRGHRRTYVGAMPGRIVQGIKNAGTKNPVFMMDEIDKVGSDFHGDPSSALLEVLDPEQNHLFSDHYLEVSFDLSHVFFITTANVLFTIPGALLDRMEVIEFSGYTDEEKFHIAKDHLLPKTIKSHGLEKYKLIIDDEALKTIIHSYTREAGVRNMERRLAEIARKTARQIAEGKKDNKTLVTRKNLHDFLGPEEFEISMREEKDEIGVATGLAWTPSGGEIMPVEVRLMPGRGNLTITGQLGEVMQESAKAALSYIRSKNNFLDFDRNFYDKTDVHIHVPSGAIPKDGPSAGTAIATALASALTKRKVKKEVAMSGEITLSGKVLKIGGVKEKALAAHRSGAEIIILPKENEKDMHEVPDKTKNEVKFEFVKDMDDILKIALM